MDPIRLEIDSNTFSNISDKMIQKNIGVKSTFRLHTHDYYEFFFVTSGRAIHLVNGVSQVISRGSLVLIRPSDEHCYDYYKEDDFVFYNAGIRVDQFKRVIDFYGLEKEYFDLPLTPLHVHLSGETEKDFLLLLDRLKNMSDGKPRSLLFLKVLSDVIFLLLTENSAEDFQELPSWLLALISDMDRPENYIAGLPRLLQLANYSQSYVNRAFQRYLYSTPTHYINDLRLRHVCQLLSSTNLPILDIAIASGFNNMSHFYSCFKDKYGICPSDFRDKRNLSSNEEPNTTSRIADK